MSSTFLRRPIIWPLLGLFSTIWWPAAAQAPDADKAIYMDACFVKATGETRGQAFQVSKSQGAFKLVFQDFRGYPRPPVDAVGEIVGSKITFEAKIVGLPVRFEGTITPQEIRGRFSNADNDKHYDMEVRWPILPPGKSMPDCP